MLGRAKKTDFYRDGIEVIKSTIDLKGKDWTFKQHVTIDTTPSIDDFKKTIYDYLSWKVKMLEIDGANDE